MFTNWSLWSVSLYGVWILEIGSSVSQAGLNLIWWYIFKQLPNLRYHIYPDRRLNEVTLSLSLPRATNPCLWLLPRKWHVQDSHVSWKPSQPQTRELKFVFPFSEWCVCVCVYVGYTKETNCSSNSGIQNPLNGKDPCFKAENLGNLYTYTLIYSLNEH